MAANQAHLLLCCDWGTSNFRLYLADRESGALRGFLQNKTGVKSLHQAIEANPKLDRITHFREFLHQQVQLLGQQTNLDVTGIPVSISGMAGSSIGCVEVPYAPLPFSLSTPRLASRQFSSTDDWPNPLCIWGGLRAQIDVMRGEEVQMIGIQSQVNERNFHCL
ncbi:MAG: 2-dehydro-3-deoxygalactonokinase, partial [Bacteroidota bacterium]